MADSKPKNILVLTYWSYKDALIQTYTLPYIRIILKFLPIESKIYLFTLEQKHLRLSDIDSKNLKEILRGDRIEWIPVNYIRFGLRALFNFSLLIPRLSYLVLSKGISHIHSWCTPAGALGYILSMITRKPLILDSYEPQAEPMKEGGTWAANSWAFKILFYLEKKQLERASEVIFANEGMIKYSQKTYNIVKPRYFWKPACVDLELFSLDKTNDLSLKRNLGLANNNVVCIYAGKFGGLYLESDIFVFFKVAYNYWKDRFKVLLLTSHSIEDISKYASEVDIPIQCFIIKFVPHSEVPQYMGIGDFGFCPMKSLPSRRYGAPIKTGEYYSLGLPVVITPDISDDSNIIEENNVGAIWYYKEKRTYIDTIKKIDFLLKHTPKSELQIKIRAIAEKYRSFEIAENIYKDIYSSI